MYRWASISAFLLVLIGSALAGPSGLSLTSLVASPLFGSVATPFYILSATDSPSVSRRYICTTGDVRYATNAAPQTVLQGFTFAATVTSTGQVPTDADWCQYIYLGTGLGSVLVHSQPVQKNSRARIFRIPNEFPTSTLNTVATFSFPTYVSSSGFTSNRVYVALYSEALSDRKIVSFDLTTSSVSDIYSFPTTLCGLSNCHRVTGVPGLPIQAYVNSNFPGGVMVFGTISGRVIIIKLDDNIGESYSAAAGVVTSMAAAPDASGSYKLFLCSESGILTTWDFAKKSIEAIFVLDFVGRTWASDSSVSPPVLYIAGGGNGEGRISRFNPRDSSTNFNQFDTTNAPGARDFKSLVVRADQKLIAIADTNTTTAKADVWVANMVSCFQYPCSSCGDASNDADYCGWCTGSSSCTFNLASQCSLINQWSRPPRCPVVTGMNVTEGAVEGGTPVRFVGDNFFADPAKYKCVFIGTEVSAVQVTTSSVVCIAPAGTGIGTAALKFNGALVPNTTSLPWEFFSCTNRGCDTCALRAGCAWCNRLSKCMGANSVACGSGAYGTTCPSIAAANATRAAFNVSIPVTFTINGLKTDLDAGGAPTFTCGWPSFNTTAVVVKAGNDNTNMLSCMTPVATGSNYDFIPVIYVNQNVFTAGPTPVRMSLYDCSEVQFQACFTCIFQNPECRFCAPSRSCGFSSVPCTETPRADASGCPRITQVTPSALHQTADAGANVTLQVTSVFNGPAFCYWTNPSATVSSSAALAKTPVGGVNTTIVCQVPATLSVGTWTLTIYENSNVLTNPAQINVYSCDGVDCDTCVSSDRPKCGWCIDTVSCAVSGSCPYARFVNSSNSMTCPRFSFDPARDTTAGTNPITIAFSPGQEPSSTSMSNAKCWFVDINQNTTLLFEGGSYHCLSPVNNIAMTSVRIVIGDVLFATSFGLFEIFDCTFAAPSSKRNCTSCFDYPGCNWCRAECVPEQVRTCSLARCPLLTSIDEPFAETRASTTVTIRANVDIPSDSYECLFGTGDSVVRVSASANATRFLCATPEGVSGYQQVSIAATGSPEVGGGRWASNSLTLKFVDCPVGLSSCSDTCWFAHEECGWCADSASCTGPTECTKLSRTLNGAFASPVWLRSSNKCPTLAGVQPGYVQVQQPNKTIVETLTLDVSGLPLASLNTTAKKRLIDVANFTCYFRGIAVEEHLPILGLEETSDSTRFFCHAPSLPYATAYSAQIAYNNNPLSPNIYLFQARDCLAVKRCGLCIISPDCGWCRGSSQCMTKAWCSAEPFPYHDSECPVIRGPSPSIGLVSGSETVTISGGKFVNSSDFVVAVGDEFYNATFVDETTLIFTTGPQSAGPKNVALFFKGLLYHEPTGNLTFTFNVPAEIVNQTPAIAASLAVAAAAVIGIVVTLIVMKRRRVGFFGEFKLKEPNYNDVAFGVFQAPMYRFPKDNYDLLAMKLLAKDHGFVFSLLATTAATEQDAVAKSLIYLYEHRKRAVEYMVVFISDEVKRNQTENTIFRNNSMASKMFKYYSKIVGVKYLFSTLARFIVELNKLSEYKSSSTSAGGETSKSLLSMEMEVDPNKYGEDAMVDSDANVLQLQFACQKVFTAIRATLKEVPPEFTQVFQSMREAIMNKFQSEDAILKAVGGFLFLRFIAPALTAPHAYGLLEKPPNPICQRQLVLIGKIIQNLANMTMPGAKETFMLQLGDFFTRNIPKMKQYYSDLLNLNAAGLPPTEICTITDTICHNALASLWGQVHMSVAKLRAHFDKEAAEDEARKRELNNDLSELLEAYPKAPRKAKEGDKKNEKDKD